MNVPTAVARGQAFALSRMTDQCDILARTVTADVAGGTSTVWAIRARAVACYVMPSSRLRATGAAEAAVAGRVQSTDAWIVLFPPSTPVDETCRLVFSGSTFEVTHVEARRTVELYRETTCVEVR